MEVEVLRAKVALHEQESTENEEIRESLIMRDNDLMDQAESSIQKREEVITELSNKLELTMDTLELERYQQRQRRQIIFPVSKHQQMMAMQDHMSFQNKVSDENSALVKSLSDQLNSARDEAKIAQTSLREVNLKALQREEQLQERCEQLAEELRTAKLGVEVAKDNIGSKEASVTSTE